MIPFPEFGQLTQEVGAILQQFYQLEQSVATANQQQTIETATLLTESMVQQILDIVRQIQADTQYIRSALGIVDNRLLAAIGTPQQANSPVVLPSTPPAGYGGLDATATGSAVWDAVSADEATSFGTIVAALSVYLRTVRDSLGFEQRIAERFLVNFDPFTLINNPNTSFTSHSAAEIDSGDATLLDFLQRIEPTWTWNQLGDGTYWANLPGTSGGALMYCTLTPGEFTWYKATNGGTLPTTLVPPVFPGLANVTYGSTQSMDAPNGSLSGPADGYKIVIDAVPSWAGKFDFGVVQSWRNVGAIAFVDDEGVSEPPQTLGITPAIYVPRSMAHSVGAYYRIATGYHATATAFTINS